MVGAGAYIAARPALKSKALRALKPFPRLQARLARAARPNSATEAPQASHEQVVPLRIDDLTASARRVYQDLLDARAARSKSRGTL